MSSFFLPRWTTVGRVTIEWAEEGEIGQRHNFRLKRAQGPFKRLVIEIRLSKQSSVTAEIDIFGLQIVTKKTIVIIMGIVIYIF